jgi:hypothetical protein
MNGGTGADSLRHIKRNFIQPKVAKGDTDPEGAIASYEYTKHFSETGMEFNAELLNSGSTTVNRYRDCAQM